MKCKKIQELIMTDYLDNEADDVTRREIERHLQACQDCRKLLEAGRAAVKQPFENQHYLQPPQSVWSAIREQMIPEKREQGSPLANIQYALQDIFLTRRVALAVITTLFAVVITVGVLERSAGNKKMLEAYFEEQTAAYASLQNVNGGLNGTTIDFGTALEEYFL